ncbi:MAG: sigma-54-dependent transcriptional regulator [bacterium]
MPKGRYNILVVDDEKSMREFFTIMLIRLGYNVYVASDGRDAISKLEKQNYDLVISDIQMPHADGFEVLQFIKQHAPETIVIMITAFSTTEQAVEAMKQGAYDYITKPFNNDEVRLIIKNALERKDLRRENEELKAELAKRYSLENLVGKSKCMQEVFDLVHKAAANMVNVLLTGESGTGKELVARAIHFHSDRRKGSFIAIHCGAIPENLLESELFGHEKGAFTGAIKQKSGLFEEAAQGTIFLDEIGELSLEMQVKLLRVLQEREFRRVGGIKNIHTDARIISATNRNLENEVAQGTFREDLYYRINVFQIRLPSLRERRKDIPLLISHLYNKLTGKKELKVTEGAMKCLFDYDWPGNIRELENVLERCIVLGHTDILNEDSLPKNFTKTVVTSPTQLENIPAQGFELDAYLAGIEQEVLLKALEKSNGSREDAARLLGISMRSMKYRLSKFNIESEVNLN